MVEIRDETFKVVFLGGPKDGETLLWNGGDIIEFAETGSLTRHRYRMTSMLTNDYVVFEYAGKSAI